MRKLVYYIAMSIDGFIAGPDDEVEFYPQSEEYTAWMMQEFPDTIPTHIRALVGLADVPNRHFDTVVMGRRTYDPALAENITSPYAHLRQYVVTRSLTEQLDPAVELVATDPVAKIRELKAENTGRDIYLAGGGNLAGQLLGEIDELIVKRYPVVAGAGLPAFSAGFSPTPFDLTEVKTFDGGNAVAYYTRSRSASPSESGS